MSKYTNLLSEEIKEKIEEYMIEKIYSPTTDCLRKDFSPRCSVSTVKRYVLL